MTPVTRKLKLVTRNGRRRMALARWLSAERSVLKTGVTKQKRRSVNARAKEI